MDDIWGSQAHALLWQPVTPGEAARDMTREYGGSRKLHILEELDDTMDAKVLLFAAYESVSPYEFSKDQFNNSKYSYGMPGELDLSGDTIYIMNDDYDDIIDELSQAGFTIDNETYDDFVVAVK